MSDSTQNRIPDENQEGGQQNQSKGKKGVLLDYTLNPYEGGAGFQINFQHPAVTRYLEQMPFRTFTASNGMKVGLGYFYSEWRESENTILLDDPDSPNKQNFDTTYFQTMFRNNGKVVRDRKINAFHLAFQELVAAVDNAFDLQENQSRIFRGKTDGRYILNV